MSDFIIDKEDNPSAGATELLQSFQGGLGSGQ